MSSRQPVTSGFNKSKYDKQFEILLSDNPRNLVVRSTPKVVSADGRDVSGDKKEKSLCGYLAARCLIPILLTFLLAIVKGGIPFIILMWVIFFAANIYNYREMYPPDRSATPEEVDLYLALRKKEAIDLYYKYCRRCSNYDIYGNIKDPNEEFSKGYQMALEANEKWKIPIPFYYERLKKQEKEYREEMKKTLDDFERVYGPNWVEDFIKEVESHGIQCSY